MKVLEMILSMKRLNEEMLKKVWNETMEESSSSSSSVDESLESSLMRWIKFSLILSIEPFSLLCNLMLIFYLIKDRKILRTLHHHVLLLLLIVSFLTNSIEIPRILDYLRLGFVRPSNRWSCLIWQFCDYLFFAQSNLYMFWASFERHLLVFHSKLFLIRKQRFYFHYFPLIFLLIYSILFYLIVIFFIQCEENFELTRPLCGSPCFTLNSHLSLYDLFLHSWIPILSIAFFSLTLILRVCSRPQIHSNQQNQWRRYRRMILQLIIISSIYILCLGPYTLIQIIDLIFILPPTAEYIQNVHLFYLYWLLSLLFPFVSIHCLPELKTNLRQFIRKISLHINVISPS